VYRGGERLYRARADGYQPEERMAAGQAEGYHTEQIETRHVQAIADAFRPATGAAG
jgi:hypothetical protein